VVPEVGAPDEADACGGAIGVPRARSLLQPGSPHRRSQTRPGPELQNAENVQGDDHDDRDAQQPKTDTFHLTLS
jgi:hypothetical protein